VHQETYKVLGGLHRQESYNRNTIESANPENMDNENLFNMLAGLAD